MKIKETMQYQEFLRVIEALNNAGYEAQELKSWKNRTLASVRKNSSSCGFLTVTQPEGMAYWFTFIDIFDLFGFKGYYSERKLAQYVIDRGGSVCWPAGSFIYGYAERNQDNHWLKTLERILN